jgi:serine/threonine protein kinase
MCSDKTGNKAVLKKVRITKRNLRNAIGEVQTLHEIKHENVVQLVSCFIVSHDELWIFLDYPQMGHTQTYP